MAIYQPKTRTVSFRVSEAEYERVAQSSIACGAESISDYARIVACHAEHLDRTIMENDIVPILESIQATLSALELKLAGLLELYESGKMTK